jgi:replicative DNA helicase
MAITTMYDAVLDAFRNLERRLEHKRSMPSEAPTGIPELDDAIEGLFPGEVVALSGDRTSDARWLACFLALNACSRDAPKRGVLYVSGREREDRFALRMIALESRVPLARLRGPELNVAELSAVTQAADSHPQASGSAGVTPLGSAVPA